MGVEAEVPWGPICDGEGVTEGELGMDDYVECCCGTLYLVCGDVCVCVCGRAGERSCMRV